MNLERMNQCEKRVCKLYTIIMWVLYTHICFNTHFPFCVCIYLKHKHRQYAPQRLSRNNSVQVMLRTDFVRNGNHWNWAVCYGREESIRCKNSSRAYMDYLICIIIVDNNLIHNINNYNNLQFWPRSSSCCQQNGDQIMVLIHIAHARPS